MRRPDSSRRPMLCALILALALGARCSRAQTRPLPENAVSAPAARSNTDDNPRPLPDLASLMQQVITHQRAAENVRKDYLYNMTIQMDRLEKDGSPKRMHLGEYEVYTVDGVSVEREIKRDGKELTPDEQRKQEEEITKKIAKAREKRSRADAQGRDTDTRGDEMIPVSRMFELGSFSNPRRVSINGRDTIATDFTGNPKAKTHNRGEDVIHDMAGTAWIDEADKTIQHIQGRFIHDFKVAGGLVASVGKDTTFELFTKKINDELWLPDRFSIKGHARFMLLLSIDGQMQMQASNYRRFRAKSTILPGMAKVDSAEDSTGNIPGTSQEEQPSPHHP